MSFQSERSAADTTADVLLEKLQSRGKADGDQNEDPAAETAALLADTAETLHGGDQLHVDDGLVKESLDELLVMLIALRTKDAHGKGIMGDLNRFFGTNLSPGTVYPALHDLEESGVLQVHELVQTKEYTVGDGAAARENLREAMRQHFAMGVLFERVLDEMGDE